MPPAVLTPAGQAWARLAGEVALRLPVSEIDGIWQFRSIRHGQKEWGTAVLARLDGDTRERLRIYTARYVHTIKGKERGRFEWALEEVGSGPLDALTELMAGVQRRMDDEVPTAVDPTAWFQAALTVSPPDGAPRAE